MLLSGVLLFHVQTSHEGTRALIGWRSWSNRWVVARVNSINDYTTSSHGSLLAGKCIDFDACGEHNESISWYSSSLSIRD